MSDLVEFLEARIADDEAAAREALGVTNKDAGRAEAEWELAAAWDFTWGERHDVSISPERVLAECEAKRRVASRHERCGTGMGPCDEYSPGLACEAAHLAVVYSEHPGYRSEWRP